LPRPDSTERTPLDSCHLYLITPPAFDLARFADQLAAALDAGDVGCVQLRLKDADDDAIRRAAERLLKVTSSRDVALLMNDRPDLAAATGCDGVHIGQEDATYAKARAAVGTQAIVGVTCHASPHLAMEAAEQGADYVAFGAFFPSASKDASNRATLDVLQGWSTIMTVPCVAIGGITAENCGALVGAGADFVAVISAVWSHPDGPAAGVRAMNAAIAAGAAMRSI
jgi:thiamine-phosphate pyrophosphorylase